MQRTTGFTFFIASASIVISGLCNSSVAFAQAKPKAFKVDSSKIIEIEYKNVVWNRQGDKSDRAFLLVRDSISKKLVRVEMNESTPNSSVFKGIFQINWGEGEIVPEVYIPPQKTVDIYQKELENDKSLIEQGALIRKPFFLKPYNKQSYFMTIYDSKDQALKAFESYRKTLTGLNIVDASAVKLQAEKALQLQKEALAKVAESLNAERKMLEVEELKRIEELKNKQASMSAALIEANKQKARDLAALALKDYKNEKFAEAEKKFSQATELDPNNKTFFFQYGVCLYKNSQYNRALVVLDYVEDSKENPSQNNEKKYYQALSYMKLNDRPKAAVKFADIKSANDPRLSGAAAYFLGIIEFEDEKYDSAKTNFEYTIDHSIDPKMDAQSENYIEQIASIKAYEKEAQKKFIYTFNGGLQYDSNILNASTPSTPTDLAGYRLMYGLNLEYRAIYKTTSEFSILLGLNDLYSTDQSFKPKTDFQNTDPLIFNIQTPWKLKFTSFGKASQLTVNPYYEIIQVNTDTVGARETILNTTALKTALLLIMDEDWFSQYSFDVSQDKSLIAVSSTENDQSASKMVVSTQQTAFSDKKKTSGYIYDLGYTMNNATGINQAYNKIDLGISYFTPAFYNTTAFFNLALNQSNYSKSTTSRKESTQNLTAALRKPYNDKLTFGSSLTFTNNTSNIDTNKYNKYLLILSASYTDAF